MRLYEAIESGRPFKRPNDKEWFIINCGGTAVPESSGDFRTCEVLPPTRDNVCATDWEIQEPMVTITRAEFVAAYRRFLTGEGSRREMRHGEHLAAEDVIMRSIVCLSNSLFGD